MRIFLTVAIMAAWILAAAAPSSHAGEDPVAQAAADIQIAGPEKGDGFETYVVTSAYQVTPCQLYVLLPSNFDRNKRYKVLYVLPAWAPSKDGIVEAKKLGLADKYDIICVGPEFSAMPWYADHPDNPEARNESYLPEVIVPFVDNTYPTVAAPDGRLLVGFSKSGIGAVTLLLHYPDIFGRAGSWDAPLMEDTARVEYYGSQENFMKNYYIPNLLADKAGILTGKPARIAITGLGWGGTSGAHEEMVRLGIPHYYNELPQGMHEWSSGWLAPLVNVLMCEDMTKPAEVPEATAPAAASPSTYGGTGSTQQED